VAVKVGCEVATEIEILWDQAEFSLSELQVRSQLTIIIFQRFLVD
jgi:hypothetical protein